MSGDNRDNGDGDGQDQPPGDEPPQDQPPDEQPPYDQPPQGQPSQGQPTQDQPPYESQGGQPVGSQPPGGQPQRGDQPQGGQPPHGQPQGGHPPRQRRVQQPSGPNPIQEWSIYGTSVFALAGAGVGLFLLLFEVFDESILTVTGAANGFGGGGAHPNSLYILITAMVVLLLAPFVGMSIARRVEFGEPMTYKIVAAPLAAGAAAVVFLTTIFVFIGSDNVSLEFAGFLLTLILAAGGAAGLGVGGVWVERNQAPELESPSDLEDATPQGEPPGQR